MRFESTFTKFKAHCDDLGIQPELYLPLARILERKDVESDSLRLAMETLVGGYRCTINTGNAYATATGFSTNYAAVGDVYKLYAADALNGEGEEQIVLAFGAGRAKTELGLLLEEWRHLERDPMNFPRIVLSDMSSDLYREGIVSMLDGFPEAIKSKISYENFIVPTTADGSLKTILDVVKPNIVTFKSLGERFSDDVKDRIVKDLSESSVAKVMWSQVSPTEVDVMQNHQTKPRASWLVLMSFYDSLLDAKEVTSDELSDEVLRELRNPIIEDVEDVGTIFLEFGLHTRERFERCGFTQVCRDFSTGQGMVSNGFDSHRVPTLNAFYMVSGS